MSPASNEHGCQQAQLIILLTRHVGSGEVIAECSINTTKGVKVADVVWASGEFFERNGYATPYLEAPEICVEIISPSNSEVELSAKMELYFEQGAREVWLCDSLGNIDFHSPEGPMSQSILVSDFPDKI